MVNSLPVITISWQVPWVVSTFLWVPFPHCISPKGTMMLSASEVSMLNSDLQSHIRLSCIMSLCFLPFSSSCTPPTELHLHSSAFAISLSLSCSPMLSRPHSIGLTQILEIIPCLLFPAFPISNQLQSVVRLVS